MAYFSKKLLLFLNSWHSSCPYVRIKKFYILLLWWQMSTLSAKQQTMWQKHGCHREGSRQEEEKVEGDKNGGISGHGRRWCHSKWNDASMDTSNTPIRRPETGKTTLNTHRGQRRMPPRGLGVLGVLSIAISVILAYLDRFLGLEATWGHQSAPHHIMVTS